MHPSQRHHDVKHAGVAATNVPGTELRKGEKAEHVQAMIQMDDHDVLLACEMCPIVPIGFAESYRKASAMTPEHDRTLAVIGGRGGPHIESEAVLAHRMVGILVPDH